MFEKSPETPARGSHLQQDRPRGKAQDPVGHARLDPDRHQLAVVSTAPRIALATTAGECPKRKARIACSRLSAIGPTIRVLAGIGVSITPGQIALTPTPERAQPARRHCENMITAAFEVQ